MSMSEREEIKELVDLLGKNFNIGVFFEHKDTLKSMEAYGEALNGVINNNHGFSLLKSLTHNLITDFKRCKIKTDEYGSIERSSDAVRRSDFTLVDAFTALCEVSLPKDQYESVEKADVVIHGYIHLLATSLHLHESLGSMLSYADGLIDDFEIGLSELETTEAKAKYVKETLGDVMYQLLPTPVSDVGDFADEGSHMCKVFLQDVEDTLAVLHGEEYSKFYRSEFGSLLDAVEYFVSDIDKLLARINVFIYDDESVSDEDVLDIAEDVIGCCREYIGKAFANRGNELITNDEMISESQSLVENIGIELGHYFTNEVLNPIMIGIETGMKGNNPAVNAFDFDEMKAITMSMISAKLNLHDKMTMAMDGSMCVSYDGSMVDEDMNETINNIYHERESEDASREVPIADILLDSTNMAEGWIESVFSIYKAMTAQINNY